MKKALILGGGSLLGLELSHLLSKNYELTIITSSQLNLPNANIININWSEFGLKKLNSAIYHYVHNEEKVDLILFNQNSKAGPNNPKFFDADDLTCLYKDWLKGFSSDCMIPYYVLQNLNKNIDSSTKVCWMFSSLINEFINIEKSNHASYRGFKITNYFIMQSFAENLSSLFFGIDPGHVTDENRIIKAQSIVDYINTVTVKDKGQVYSIENKRFWQPLAPTTGSNVV